MAHFETDMVDLTAIPYGANFSLMPVLCENRLRNGSREILAIVLESTVKISQLYQLVTDYY